MPTPPEFQKLGHHAFLIPSPLGETQRCAYLLCHGRARAFADPFETPIEVRFLVQDGHPLRGAPAPTLSSVQHAEPHMPRDPSGRVYAQGSECPNYELRKALGRHARSHRLSYQDALEEVQPDAATEKFRRDQHWRMPHVITVRNRVAPAVAQTIWLRDIVTELATWAGRPQIAILYAGICRNG